MAARFPLFACFMLCAVIGCGDNPTGPAVGQFNKNDLVGVWKGDLSRLVILKETDLSESNLSQFIRANPGYMPRFDFAPSLVEINLGNSTYWIIVTFQADTIQASYSEWGSWEWRPETPDLLFFDSTKVNIYVDVINPLGINSYSRSKIDQAWHCRLNYEKATLNQSGFSEATLKLDEVEGRPAFSEFNLEKLPYAAR